MGSRLEEIAARLEHEPCCDHSGRDETGNCWECRDTGCAHPPYVEDQAKDDLAALLAVVREVAEMATDLEDQPPCGATSEEQWSMDTERAVARDLRRILAPLSKEETQ